MGEDIEASLLFRTIKKEGACSVPPVMAPVIRNLKPVEISPFTPVSEPEDRRLDLIVQVTCADHKTRLVVVLSDRFSSRTGKGIVVRVTDYSPVEKLRRYGEGGKGVQ